MTQLELDNLPIDKQRNAMLTIALGRDAKDYYHKYVNESLILSEPQNDGALMWKLVCELSNVLYDSKWCTLANSLNFADAVIDAFIENDPFRLIAKWRSEQQKSDTITSDNLEIDARTSNNL